MSLSLEFQANRIESFAEFVLLRQQIQTVLDNRYIYEKSLASSENSFELEGMCGACIRSTVFTVATIGGEEVPGKLRVPNWRETVRCDCPRELINRHRAVLHFLRAKTGLHQWTRAAFLGPSEILGPLVRAEVEDCRIMPRLINRVNGLGQSQLVLEENDQARQIVVSLDYLHLVPPLETALSEACRILVPGGMFVFTVPFHADSEETVSFTAHLPRMGGLLPAAVGGGVHDIGWSILPALRAAGFSQAAAYLYWSEELGYFGPYNFIFSATR